jgi:small-conductance mechanosensitive channel
MRSLLRLCLSASLALPSPAAASAAARAVVPARTAPVSGVGLPALPLPVLPAPASLQAATAAPAPTPALPNISAPAAAAAAASVEAAAARAIEAPRAQAQLERAQAALAAAPEGAAVADPASDRALSERVWSGAGEAARSSDAVPAASSASPRSTLARGRRAAAAAVAAAVAAAPGTAHADAGAALSAAASWLGPVWHAVQPYVEGGLVLGATYLAHRVARWAVQQLAKRAGWEPNTTDTVRFLATLSTWALGAVIGFKLAGASTTALLTGFGVAMTLAVKKTIGNLLQGVQFLVNRPFVIGDKVRVADNLYVVEDMELQYVTMRQLGKLVLEKPEVVPDGVAYVPFKDVDPLGREADDKGYKWVLVRKDAPGPGGAKDVAHEAKLRYTNLAAASLTLFRAYTPIHQLHKPDLGALKPRFRPLAALGAFVGAARQTPRGSVWKAVVWMGVAVALIPLLPWLERLIPWDGAAALFPYVHGLSAVWATRQVARFFERFVPLLGKRLGWSHQATVVLKLLSQVGVYFVGLSAALRALGLGWGVVGTSLGATAAAMSFASIDILGNLALSFMLRFDRPFNIGDTLRVGTDVGVVQEMNMFHVVLKVAEGSHTLVPYSVIDAASLETFPPNGAAPERKADR